MASNFLQTTDGSFLERVYATDEDGGQAGQVTFRVVGDGTYLIGITLSFHTYVLAISVLSIFYMIPDACDLAHSCEISISIMYLPT